MVIDIIDETGEAGALAEPARGAVAAAFSRLAFEAEAAVTFVSAEDMRGLNREHRGVDAVTDVLSFPMFERGGLDKPPAFTPVHLGDIVICRERALEQAAEYGHGIAREAAFLAAHGALHLLGFDHEGEDDEREMFGRQEEILASMGLAR